MKCPKIKAISGLIGIGIAVALMGLSLLFGLLYGDDGNVNVICIIGMILGFAIFLISAIAMVVAAWQKKHPEASGQEPEEVQEEQKTESEPSPTEGRKGKRTAAVVLLVVQIGLSIGNFFADTSSFVLTITFLFECLPMIGALILIYYDDKYRAPIVRGFTVLRVWTMILIWVQPCLTFVAYLVADLMSGTVMGLWLGGCVFLIAATVLLYLDGREETARRSAQNMPSEKPCSPCDHEDEKKDD